MSVPESGVIQLTNKPREIDRIKLAEDLRITGFNCDVNKDAHGVLRARSPWVKDRGCLQLAGAGWTYYAGETGDYFRWHTPENGSGGWLMVWLGQLEPGKDYVITFDVSCTGGGPDPRISFQADGSTEQTQAAPPEGVLKVILTPLESLTVLHVGSQDLSQWTVHSILVMKLD
jgi:hypothetical protein